MAGIDTTSCCGVGDFLGMNHAFSRGAEGALAALWQSLAEGGDWGDPGWAYCHILLTEAREPKQPRAARNPHRFEYGHYHLDGVLALIRKHKLGRVVVSPRAINPNSGNDVRAAIFTYNKARFDKWMENNFSDLYRNYQEAEEEMEEERARWI